VAKRLGVSVPTVQRWVDAGRLKAWKTIGGHRRVDADSADLLFRQQESRAVQAANDAALSVVIVDDNPDDRELLAAMIEMHLPGAKITLAENGYEGLIKIGQREPDLVITDIMMPKMDGFEMIAQLLAHSHSKQPAVLAMSSLKADQLAQHGALPAAVRLLPKPLDLSQVTEALDAVLRVE
jgi:excisionase family DNA binding protein